MHFTEYSTFSLNFNILFLLLAAVFSIPSLGQTSFFPKQKHKTCSGGLPTQPDSTYLTLLLLFVYGQVSSLGCNLLELLFLQNSYCALTTICWKTKWMRIQVKFSQKEQGIE